MLFFGKARRMYIRLRPKEQPFSLKNYIFGHFNVFYEARSIDIRLWVEVRESYFEN